MSIEVVAIEGRTVVEMVDEAEDAFDLGPTVVFEHGVHFVGSRLFIPGNMNSQSWGDTVAADRNSVNSKPLKPGEIFTDGVSDDLVFRRL